MSTSLAFGSLPWERYAPWLDTAPSSNVVRGNLPVPPQTGPLHRAHALEISA